ncbi:MAG: hypothetical protein SFZ02_19245 [bacterium]|nr:hypothetical protein [bacterium]
MMAQHDMADSGGYDEKSGFVRCPLCGEYAHNMVYETFEGKWTFCACGVELCHDGFVVAGNHLCIEGYWNAQKHILKDIEGMQ